jgi:hypothetical protein
MPKLEISVRRTRKLQRSKFQVPRTKLQTIYNLTINKIVNCYFEFVICLFIGFCDLLFVIFLFCERVW